MKSSFLGATDKKDDLSSKTATKARVNAASALDTLAPVPVPAPAPTRDYAAPTIGGMPFKLARRE